MIRINLLPEEFRRSERTSFKLFAATLAAVVLVCSAFGWFAYAYFGEYGEARQELAREKDKLASVTERAAYHDHLEKEKKDYEARQQTIKDIAMSRMLWSEVLDQVLDVVNNDGNTERHLAWFQGVSVREAAGNSGPQLAMPGWVQGANISKVADFHDDIENAPFFQDVKEMSFPGGRLEVDGQRQPPEALRFDLRMTFKPAKDWSKNRPDKGAKPAAKPAGK